MTVTALLRSTYSVSMDARGDIVKHRLNRLALLLIVLGVIGGALASKGMTLNELVRTFPF
jgi:hypothetical protein